jgi:lambda family phage portal protein
MPQKQGHNWIDNFINYLSPRWGAERAAWRAYGSYDAGSSGIRNIGWSATNTPGEATNQSQRDTIRARARDLERNSDVAEAVLGALERNIVGTGIVMQAKVEDASGNEDDAFNTLVEDLWEKWCEPRNCDISGELSFFEMQDMIVRRKAVDGGILIIKTLTNDPKHPLKLQLREVDDIDSSINSYYSGKGGENRIINGVEIDDYNRPVAYWLRTIAPDGLWMNDSTRVTADRVIYLRKKVRPTQIREMSEMSRTAPGIRDINEYAEAISVKERIMACLSVFIRKASPVGGVGRGPGVPATIESNSKLPELKLSPGLIQQLGPGDDVSVINPSGQAGNAKDFFSFLVRKIGAGKGLSYETVSRDVSQVNYSSARQNLLEDRKTYRKEQKYLITHFCREVYTAWFISMVLSGQLNIPDFWRNKERYLKHTWLTPGWEWIDPLKEVKANETGLLTGQMTLADICAAKGQDWRDNLKQRAKEQEYAKELGLNLGGNDNGAQAQQDEAPADDDEEQAGGGATAKTNA